MKKTKILRIIHSLDLRYGGPQNAIIDHSISLKRLGIDIEILTTENKHSYKGNNLKNIKIFYQGKSFSEYGFNIKLFKWLLKNKNKYDYFIIHGLWSFYTLIARILIKKKYFVFSHGQLDPFFSSEFFKRIKKQIYWNLIEKRNLLCARSLLLTSLIEKKLINNTYVNTKNIKKQVVRYGILDKKIDQTKVLKTFYNKFPYLKNKKFLLFLGRFHEKKGCKILINSLKKLSNKNIKINVLFAGPNNKNKNELINLSKKYGLEKRIFWSDVIINDFKWGAILASSGMVLSSRGENFGVSLVESLRFARPVFTTYKVNIYKEILDAKAGFISKDNPDDFSLILEKFYKLKNSELKILSINAYKCFKKNFDLSVGKNNFLNLINKN